jgi:exopolyphosphatase/guanosine-5'-triphosphate,3'-diphosphate pyrophosphatase
METVAVMDLGSNSARLAVFEIQFETSFAVKHRAFEMIRLAASLSEDKMLSQDAFGRTADALCKLKRTALGYGASVILCVATEAVRRAKNGVSFLEFIEKETGLAFQIISGEKEAHYGFLTAAEGLSLSDFVLLDTGGASVELSLVRHGNLLHSISLPIGSLLMHRKFIHSDPVNSVDLSALHSFLHSELSNICWLKEGMHLPVAGLGGTNKCIAKLDCPGNESYQRYQLTAERIREIYRTVAAASISERASMQGIEQGRQDTILSGMAVMITLMELLDSPGMVISEWGLDYGIFMEYWNKTKRKEELAE